MNVNPCGLGWTLGTKLSPWRFLQQSSVSLSVTLGAPGLYPVVIQILNPNAGDMQYAGLGPIGACLEAGLKNLAGEVSQIFFFSNFHPENWGKDSQSDEHFSQMAWFNHQLEIAAPSPKEKPSLREGWKPLKQNIDPKGKSPPKRMVYLEDHPI